MTIEKLLGHSADELERMSDEELREHIGKYITYCKPLSKQEQKAANIQSGQTTGGEKRKRMSYTDFVEEQKRKARALAEQFGLKLE